MDINSYILRITSGAELADKLDTTKSFKISAELDCFAVEKRDNQDGTFNIVYKSRITSPIEVIQGETKIKGKDKKRWSQKWRGLLYFDWKESGAVGTQEDYYDIWQEKMYKNWESIKEFLKNK
jgi:hypothetical protein